jgi:hypothetical protein
MDPVGREFFRKCSGTVMAMAETAKTTKTGNALFTHIFAVEGPQLEWQAEEEEKNPFRVELCIFVWC